MPAELVLLPVYIVSVLAAGLLLFTAFWALSGPAWRPLTVVRVQHRRPEV